MKKAGRYLCKWKTGTLPIDEVCVVECIPCISDDLKLRLNYILLDHEYICHRIGGSWDNWKLTCGMVKLWEGNAVSGDMMQLSMNRNYFCEFVFVGRNNGFTVTATVKGDYIYATGSICDGGLTRIVNVRIQMKSATEFLLIDCFYNILQTGFKKSDYSITEIYGRP